LKKTILVFLSILLLSSCNNGVKYVSQKDSQNHLIDFDVFSIILPTDFRYKKVDGIDSFVGEIKNGNTIFSFDYGWYSPSPPMDKKSYIEKSRKSMDFETTQKFFDQVNVKPYENVKGEINVRQMVEKIKNLSLHNMSDSIATHNNFKGNCEFYYSLEFEGKEYKVPYGIPKEKLKQFECYQVNIDTIGSYKRTIALWTDKENPNISSVNFEPIYGNLNNKLSIGIKSDNEFDVNELQEIFKKVIIKQQ
jgi:PBP1b-binding outer membrane lipoprotein LpoB